MSLPTFNFHPLLTLVDAHKNGLKSMLTHYIDATVDSQFAFLRNSYETMIQSGVIGPNCDGTHFGMTLPQPTHTNTHQSSDECSHEYSNDQMTREQEHQNTLQDEAKTIHAESVIKREFDYHDHDEYDEDGEKIDDDSMMTPENVNCSPSLSPSNDSIKREIDSDFEENVTDHNNLPGESQFDHHNNLQNEVSLSNTINTKPMIKQEFDDENVAKCEKCENGICTSTGDDAEMGENGDEHFEAQLNVHSALENNQTTESIISNDISPSPSPTNPINSQPLIKQQCLQGSSITLIPMDFTNNTALNDISIDEQIEGQNTQIQTDQFYDNDQNNDDDYYENGEEEFLNEPICANEVCDLDNENNNNHLNSEVFAGDGEETDIETNLDEAQFDIDINVTNNTQMNNQNEEENVINVRFLSDHRQRNIEQATPSTSSIQSSVRKRIQKKVFCDFIQSNGNHRNSAKRKSDQANESGKKLKPKYVLDDDESTDSDDQEDHANNAIGEEIATECTTNPIQPNLAQPKRLQCSHCHKSFDQYSTLQTHLRVHTGERPFKCNQCDKRFKERNKLTRHQLIHQNIKRFQCDQCDKLFTQKGTLECHLRVHSGLRPYQCRFCDKSFTELRNRNTHEQAKHLHVKPYRCKLCGHTTTVQSAIMSHIRFVHFGLPQTIKQQRALNIIDDRDPKELMEKV